MINDFDKNTFTTPIALIIFNRPDYVKELIRTLRLVKPMTIYVIADGPREGFYNDHELCAASRQAIDLIDWPCQVHKRYLDFNLGCGHSPAQGLDWIFSKEEACIILEDDCVPDISFFRFCEEMLARYKDNEKIMMVSGNNHLLGKCDDVNDSYFFSINTQTHGWATWRRAWKKYDFYMKDWPVVGTLDWLIKCVGSERYARSWYQTFNSAYLEANFNQKCSYWDFQWTYACWKNQALNIIPRANLVSNCGYGDDATHVTPIDHHLAKLPVVEMSFPLKHPAEIEQNSRADLVIRETVYGFYPIWFRIIRKIKKICLKALNG